MSRSKHSEAQIVAALKQPKAGRRGEDVAREVGVSTHTIYAWKTKSGGMDATEAPEAKRLPDENTRFSKLVADLSLDKEALRPVIEKTGGSHRNEGICRAYTPGDCLHRTPDLPPAGGSGFELSLPAAPERRRFARTPGCTGTREATDVCMCC